MTAFPYLLPDLGEGIKRAEVINWLVSVGDPVREHEPLVEVETDKARVELPSPVTGVLESLGGAPGEFVTVGEPVAVFRTDTPVSAESPEPVGLPGPARPRPLAAPTVRKRARELGIDLVDVTGSGPGGRIRVEDLDAAALSGAAAPGPAASGAVDSTPAAPGAVVSTPAAPGPVQQPDADVRTDPEVTVVPLRGARRTTARRMTEIIQTVPMIYAAEELDVTDLGHLLAGLAPKAERRGVRLTWTAMFAYATVQALRENPAMNATMDAGAEEIIQHHRVHLGIATAAADGLLVPVVRNADRMSLLELADEINRLSDLARDRGIGAADLTGGTYTLSNFGSVGGWFGTMIVNAPQVGIIGFGRAEPKAVVVDGQVAVRDVVPMSSTADHRAIDGAVGALFTASVRRRLEDPQELLLGARRGDG